MSNADTKLGYITCCVKIAFALNYYHLWSKYPHKLKRKRKKGGIKNTPPQNKLSTLKKMDIFLKMSFGITS